MKRRVPLFGNLNTKGQVRAPVAERTSKFTIESKTGERIENAVDMV